MKPMNTSAAELPDPVRVLIVDDEPLFVELVQALLGAEEGIEVVGTAPDGKRGVEQTRALGPDLIVMDVSMPVMNGIEATRTIRERDPAASVLILTGGSNIAEIDNARKAGAAGYLTKDRIASDLIREVRSLGGR
jgi:two-component system, NarL family, nitrate/nitrite response regulator NarL